MPRAKKDSADADVSAAAQAGPGTPDSGQPAETAGSEQVMVVQPAADEPVRCGGYVLTDAGWVVEDQTPAGDAPAEPAEDDPADPEQEN